MKKIKIIFFAIISIFLNSCTTNSQNEDSDILIFKDDKGNELSRSDLKDVTGSYNFAIEDTTEIPEEADKLHQEAREHGMKGEYDLAIEKLKKANEVAPDWAYPIYDLAYTYLIKQDFPNALKYYEMTDKMRSRGFFTSKVSYWALKKEQEGEFQDGLYLIFMQIEWMQTDEEKLKGAKSILEKFPKYAPAWNIISKKANTHEERLEAVEKGLSLNPDADTKGSLLINKAIIKNIQEKPEEAKAILGELIFDNEATFGNIELAKFVFATIVSEE